MRNCRGLLFVNNAKLFDIHTHKYYICEMILLLAIISVLFLGVLKGIADKIQHDPEYRLNGWKAKWKDPVHRIERFRFSSTGLVFLTDKWHFCNFLQYRITDFWIAYALKSSLCFTWWSFTLLLIFFPLVRYVGFKSKYE